MRAEIAETLKAAVIGMIAEDPKVAFRELRRHWPALLCLSHSIQWSLFSVDVIVARLTHQITNNKIKMKRMSSFKEAP